MPTLRALPNRVILAFPKPAEKVGSLYVSQRSQIRPEFGVIHDVGEAIGEENAILRKILLDLQAKGIKIAVTFMSGTGYLTESQKNALSGDEWQWLDDLKSYRMSELGAFLVE